MAKLSDATMAKMDTQIGGRDDTCVAFYSRNFDALWAQVTGESAETLPRNVFLVWDEIPKHETSDDIGVHNYLTAYDWVMAMVLAAQKASAAGEAMERFEFELRILPTVALHNHPLSLAMRVTPLLQSAILPWVKLDALNAQTEFMLAGTTSGAAAPRPTLAQTFSEPRLREGNASATFIKDLWRTELTKAGVRHSVSNAIGPAALAQCLKDRGFSAADAVLRDWLESKDSLRLTFWRFLELLELLPPLVNKQGAHTAQSALGGLADRPFVKEDLFGQFKHLRFALVDDQAGAGFHEALGAFLLGPDLEHTAALTDNVRPRPVAVSTSKDRCLTLSSFSRPDVLLGWLRHVLANSPTDRSHRPVFGRHNLYAPPAAQAGSMHQFDILFLDLRLHGISGASRELDKETRWTSQLLGFADGALSGLISQYGLSAGQRHAFDAAISAARKRLGGDHGAEEMVGQLALLPILISICDPTMPVILFSSTRQRAVLDLLKPFPNIVTAFAKPAITGYAEEDLTALASVVPSMVDALHDALVLHEKRCLWDLISEFEFAQAVPPTCVVLDNMGRDMPSVLDEGKTKYLANIGRPDLLFYKTPWYIRRLRSMLLEYIVGEDNGDHLYKPYEFFESAIKKPENCERLDLYFHQRAFVPFEVAKIVNTWPLRARAIHPVKKARHKLVHGAVRGVLSDDIMKYVGLVTMLQFLFGICDKNLRNKLRRLIYESKAAIRKIFAEHLPDNNVPPVDFDSPGQVGDSLLRHTKKLWR